MPFDEKILDKTIEDLTPKVIELKAEAEKYQNYLRILMSIQDTKHKEVVNGETEIVKKRRHDARTGAPLSDSRRDEIYDSCIPKVQEFLEV